ncbi:DEAD/DEAH box helicase [Deinococcus detaillensis]|uniref:DEAD/DEAH box helicase n=1 Tax=Deinococcus detaillensis TaxID=2592048 RepID=A0A553UIX6_9DEIO|nr:DEAD/DEAH box helicase family protein [Deinococcus detaillensis]TSA79971.1 DEAD/DEAH box helicase [Deinococcus detaillensis]
MSPTLRSSILYPLAEARRNPSQKQPASHQAQALSKLRSWFGERAPVHGGILVLPTGGGKTFTAQRFLTTLPLSQGHKVIWLAHTHHLLDQAAHGFGRVNLTGGYEVGHVQGQRTQLTLRTVSGTPEHGRVNQISGSDDVLIITLQSLARALKDGRQRGLNAFLKEAQSSGLTVIFDECHHAPANSYRKMIEALRSAVPDLSLLGLTATPDYSDERRKGWLKQLFPQGILYQVSPQRLMAQRILSRPRIEEALTQVEPQLDAAEFRAWTSTHRDIPEKVVRHLAQNAGRNALIVQRYLEHRERYGRTIIFADRWYQCDALVTLLRDQGVRADAIYTQQDHDPGTTEGRNARTQTDNAAVLERFKDGHLDVIVNIRMLTEGTDVPGVQTVFLTRQTTSRILLTQMIGRALRGPQFGGTDEANVVAFIDQWKQHVNWARWDDLVEGGTEEGDSPDRQRLNVQYLSGDLVSRLARELNSGEVNTVPFLSLLPVGWYAISFDAAVEDGEAQEQQDDIETVRQLIPVFDQDLAGYQALFQEVALDSIDSFADLIVTPEERDLVADWTRRFFPEGERLTRLDQDLMAVLRHAALNGVWPALTAFEDRELYDVDMLAGKLAFEQGLGMVQIDQTLRAEYARSDRLWQTLYPTYTLLKQQFDHSVNQRLNRPQEVASPELGQVGELPESPEVPSEIKAAVKNRDRWCLCCHREGQRLQVDHIRPRYLGGTHDVENLQLLCAECNRSKGTAVMNFRVTRPQGLEPASTPVFLRAFAGDARNSDDLEQYLRRAVNLHFGCAATAIVVIRQRGTNLRRWSLTLHQGNPPQGLESLLRKVVDEVNSFRRTERVTEIETIDVHTT